MTAVLPTMALAGVLAGAALAGGGLAMAFVRLPLWVLPLAAGCALALALWLGGPASPADAIWSAALILPLTALAFIDAATRRLPDILSLALIALGLCRLAAQGDPVLPMAAAAAGLVALGLAIDRLAPDGAIGAGDILLAAAVMVWLGPGPLVELAVVLAILLWLHFLARAIWRLAMRRPGTDAGLPLAPAAALAVAALWIAALPQAAP